MNHFLVSLYSVLSVYYVVLTDKMATEYTENTEKTLNIVKDYWRRCSRKDVQTQRDQRSRLNIDTPHG